MAKRDKKGPQLVTSVPGAAEAAAPPAAPASRPAPTPSDPRLGKALATFKRGDYVHARAMLEPLLADPTLAEGERKQAAALMGATKLDDALPKTALAALALLILVVVLTAVYQP